MAADIARPSPAAAAALSRRLLVDLTRADANRPTRGNRDQRLEELERCSFTVQWSSTLLNRA
jgi:hypothetical protein